MKGIDERFIEQIEHVDKISQIVLKGHLVVEEVMTEVIGRFVFHKDLIESAKLSFSQKITLCRAMAVGEHKSSNGWRLIKAVNELRNKLSHSLDIEERSRKINSLKSACENCGYVFEKEAEDALICIQAIAFSLGILSVILEGAKQFEIIVNKSVLNVSTMKKENK